MEILFIIILIILASVLHEVYTSLNRPKRSKPTPRSNPVCYRQPKSTFSPLVLDSTPHMSDPIIVLDKQAYLKSDHWQTKRKARLKLDKYTCQGCGISGVPLEVHHLHYRTYTAERPEDLTSLCRECHERQHQYYGFDYNTDYSILI